MVCIQFSALSIAYVDQNTELNHALLFVDKLAQSEFPFVPTAYLKSGTFSFLPLLLGLNNEYLQFQF